MEQIEYTRTVVPSSMRSPYWKYFGFPSDNGNNILTRQKIVCTICNTSIAYNKNTSNLRTHLMSKHVETFQKIIMASSGRMETEDFNAQLNIQSDESFTNSANNILTITKIKRRRSELPDEAPIASIGQTRNELGINNQMPESFLALTELKKPDLPNITLVEEIDASNINTTQQEISNSEYEGFDDLNDSEIVEVTESAEENQLPDTLNSSSIEQSNQQSFTYVDVIQPIEIHHPQQQQSLENMLADMIQTDLLSLEILQSQGFCKYNQQLTGLSLDNQTLQRVTDILRQRFTNTQQLINNHLKQLSQIMPYSLSIEYYVDNNNHNILNVYFHCINDVQTELNSILFYSGRFDNADISISDLFKDINLKNCCGIVVPCLKNVELFILEFAKCHDIELIECLESLLARCLYKIFEIPEFSKDFEKLCVVIQEKTWLFNSKVPQLKPRCCWSRLNYLDYIFNNLQQNEVEDWIEMKQTLDFIKPLKMALDIVTDEPLPICTLTRPLIIKLFEEHFSLLEQKRNLRLSQIQQILVQELKESVIMSNFLNEATFFDARFHQDFALQESDFDINQLKSKVCRRFKNCLNIFYVTKPINIKTEEKSSSLLINSRKSSLKTFFKRDTSLPECTEAVNLKTNLDLEFEHYQNESCLDLDQSPVLWWQQQNNSYKELHKIAKYYLTIPCCSIPRLYRLDLEQRYLKLDRRKYLNQYCNIERNLWYMYYNDLAASEIKF